MPDDQPVAVYHDKKRHMFVLRMSEHPYLEVDPVALDTMDSLISKHHPPRYVIKLLNVHFPAVSFLLIERRRRDGRL